MPEEPLRAPDAPPVELIAVRADNPGPMTLTGTVSYVVRDDDDSWVVDPGPRDPEHLAELLLCCEGTHPRGVLVTHHHEDHAAGAAALARRLGARSGHAVPLWAADQQRVAGSDPLPSQLIGAHGTVGHIIHTPGHTDDSVCVLLDGGRLLSGDTLLGGSSTVLIPEHGGSVAEHLQSLAILRAMTIDGRIGSIHPGHGPAIEGPHEAVEVLEQQIAHRRERIDQVRRARSVGVLTLDRLLRVVYGPDLAEELHEPARHTLRAILAHLTEGG
ncbi:MBL fold metallo-hydrolase [Brachybacterium sp. UMB0905]|uniref:MBL fold metallo-hydrolase n=1 Tax=Brachybacterium sp. UMB0905 TaxID=2069310 RepID=UPI001E346583|nr:MBL fold metallo-hydrolase [Brachybacterium sp. UMB0905]